MKTFTLKRYSYTQNGTFGVLLDGDMPLVLTLEDPWNNNQRNISCIPTGSYKATPHNGTKYKNTWILNDVPNRSAILIHVGNSILDTEGCILVGRGLSQYMITQSRDGFEYLRTVLPSVFMLDIVDCDSPPKKVSWWKKLFKG